MVYRTAGLLRTYQLNQPLCQPHQSQRSPSSGLVQSGAAASDLGSDDAWGALTGDLVNGLGEFQ